ncbi:MAG: methyltransferase domain-containing protein [Anaerolineaceae bacterium]|nr:methyltransferase domain-containing protein [Anaerolineaceae bacterium]
MLKTVWRRLRSNRSRTILSSLAAYEHWANQYPPHAHNAVMKAEEATMRALFPPLSGKKVLDLACGSGRYGLIASAQGAAFSIGLDNSVPMLRQNPMELRAVSTSEKLPLASSSIDVVLCGLALGHLRELDASMSEISRVMKPNACALVSDFHPFIFLNGQQRTFTTTDGQTFAVEHYVHLYADYHQAGRKAGLRIDAVLEPRLGQLQEVQFADADTRTGTPIIIAYRFVKDV